ncbi:MAG: nitroreductase family protein [Spirochaetes bacterium]|nr:nitroreductase family protein [Spirochaetota bacterium]
MDNSVTHLPIINAGTCTGCGRCVLVCPKATLDLVGGIAAAVSGDCMLCSHCYAVCPEGAIHFDPTILRDPRFVNPMRHRASRRGGIAPAPLAEFIRSRRSVRNYTEAPVDDEILRDLVEFAVTAPSGSNRQSWRFLTFSGREKVWDLALRIGKFFAALNRIAGNPILPWLAVPFAGTALLRYRRDHMDSVEWALGEAGKGRDLLFHGAPALVIIYGPTIGSTPAEDAQFASYHIALMAHSLGLGTCHIGYAVESINRSRPIRRHLGIPPEERVHAVMTVGHPDIAFLRPALRKPPDHRAL